MNLFTSSTATPILTACSATVTAEKGAVFLLAIKYPLIFEEMPRENKDNESAFIDSTARLSLKILCANTPAPNHSTANETKAIIIERIKAPRIVFFMPFLLPLTSSSETSLVTAVQIPQAEKAAVSA